MVDESLEDETLRRAIKALAETWWQPHVGVVAAALRKQDGLFVAATSRRSPDGRFYHAESELLDLSAPLPNTNAAIAITLSPCVQSSHSRIGPPCTERLIDAGVTRVHVGSLDLSQGSLELYQRIGLTVSVTQAPDLKTRCDSLRGLFQAFGSRINSETPQVKKELGEEFVRELANC
jgi:pyrimidine deaminase RibD-like protein